MSMGLLFWILMVVTLVWGGWANWPLSGNKVYALGGSLVLFILLILLGWAVFGAPIHG